MKNNVTDFYGMDAIRKQEESQRQKKTFLVGCEGVQTPASGGGL